MVSIYFAAILFGIIGRLQGKGKNEEAEVIGYHDFFEQDMDFKKDLCMDIVFVIDRSCSVRKVDLVNEYRIIENAVNAIEGYGPDKTRIGLVTFDNGARVVFGLDDEKTSTKEKLLAKLGELKKDKSRPDECKTYTWDALKLARESASLFGGVDKNSKREKILMLITDGVPLDKQGNRKIKANETLAEGKANKKAGIKTMVFTVKNSNGVLPSKDFFEQLAYSKRWTFQVENELVESFKIIVFPRLARFTCQYKCHVPIDLIYVMDRSISITPPNIKKMKEFYKVITKSFSIGNLLPKANPKTSVAMLSYNSEVHLHFTGSNCSDAACVLEMIDGIPETREDFTVTNLALREVERIVPLYTRNGKYGIRPVVILSTDGNTWPVGANDIASSRLSIAAADRLRAWGIDTVVIAAPNHKENPGLEEMRGIASHYVFNLQSNLTSFDDLIPIAPKVVKLICDKYKPNPENEV